jgi:tripartite-type tricarboxylate transporter receptor subunit TctC
MKRAVLGALAMLWPAVVGITAASAQEKFPSRPIKIIVPFGPGSATDVTARTLGEAMKNVTGQQIVVENKPGAFGIISMEETLRNKPDGYTITLQNVSTAAITPQLHKKRFNFDFDKSFVPLTRVVELPGFFTVSPKHLPDIKSWKDLVEWSRKTPGQLRYATTGVGAFTHFEGEMFQLKAGVKWEHIPMKDGPPAFIKGILAGDIHTAAMTMPSIAGLIQSGQLVPIATTSAERVPEYPNIPTLKEQGFGDIATNNWSMMYASSEIPKPILDELFNIVTKALNDPALQANYKKQLIIPTVSKSLDEAKAFQAAEMKHWKEMMEKVKIELEN